MAELRSSLIERASNSTDLDEVKKALEALQLLDTVEDLDLSPRPPRRRLILGWASRQTALLTVVISSFTLFSTALQFFITGCSQRRANLDSQWRSAVRTLSLSDSPASLTGALNLETFYDFPPYDESSRALVSNALHYIGGRDEDAFDTVFLHLAKGLRSGDGHYVYGIDAYLRSEEWKTYSEFSKSPNSICDSAEKDQLDVTCFRRQASELPDHDKPPDDRLNMDAERLDWELDTVSRGIVAFWERHRPAQLLPRLLWWRRDPVIDFRAIVLRYDDSNGALKIYKDSNGILKADNAILLKDIDLSGTNFGGAYLSHLWLTGATTLEGADLSGADVNWANFGTASLKNAHFDRARIDCADFSNITKKAQFEGSTWDGVDISKAMGMSSELVEYIQNQTHKQVSWISNSDCSDPTKNRENPTSKPLTP